MSNKNLPYFLYSANDMVDFCKIQEKLFELGYCWYNGDTDVFKPMSELDTFPMCLSNLPSDNEKPERMCFWYSTDESDFNVKLLRSEKIKKLNKNV